MATLKFAFLRLLLPFFFFDAFLCKHCNLFKDSLRYLFGSKKEPLLVTANCLTPTSIPMVVSRFIAGFTGNGFLLSTSIDAKYLFVGVREIVMVFIFPLKGREIIIGISL